VPDVVERYNPMLDSREDWATIVVPRGETSLAAWRHRPTLDPHRKRFKCEAFHACYSEALETRDLDGEPVHMCPRHIEQWDAELPVSDGPGRAIDARDATSATSAPIVAATPPTESLGPYDAPDVSEFPPEWEPHGRPDVVLNYINRARAHGAIRAQLPSRSREARRLEKRRERARKRAAERAAATTMAAPPA
jgi:hypothetical protein